MRKVIQVIFTLTLLLLLTPAFSTKAATGNEVVNLAKEHIGTPYKFGGTTPAGFDCSGFLYYVYGQLGIKLPRTSSEQYQVGQKVSKANLQPGDLVLFSNTYKPGISHAGIYVGDNQFISAENAGIKISSLDNPYWGPKFTAGKRLDSVSQTKDFSDLTKSNPAYAAVMELSGKNIINGFDDQTFKPAKPVTRGQAAAIINRVLHVPTSSKAAYSDVSPNQSFYKDIVAMQESGIIQGYPDGTYRSNEYLSRAQMAVIVQRAFGGNASGVVKASSIYDDVASNHWAGNAISTLHQKDRTTLFQTNSFRVNDKATRAEFSAAIYNTYPSK
ncbi:C40 family peptidase [Bacillus sp. MCCB 382]|uniref:C40 family peptidase n=1 Tax=Bacillus sp. MCCB 382 TaxID=2860197 RepID=UPI001C592BC2|nr:C40 family peptidase [Bacillus sp. MCCB 382]